MTELETLKKKKKDGKATPEDLTRLKQLQDGEPLSAGDLENARQREKDRKTKDKAKYEDRQKSKAHLKNYPVFEGPVIEEEDNTALDIPPEAPQCFGRFYSLGALDCTTVCKYTEDCKRQSKNPNATLDVPPDHPRIVKMKEALLPFTQIEAHASRPDEFVLFTRGISITAGDVRKARRAMKL